MDWLTFFSKIIDSIVWPCVTVWILYFFVYKHGTKITKVIKKITYKDIAAEFRDGLEEAREEGEKTLNLKPVTQEQINEIEKIAHISPALAIMEIWSLLEWAASKILNNSSNRKITTLELIKSLHESGEISNSEFNLAKKLRDTRNIAVHMGQDNITLPEVMEYKALADILINKFKSLESKLLPHT